MGFLVLTLMRKILIFPEVNSPSVSTTVTTNEKLKVQPMTDTLLGAKLVKSAEKKGRGKKVC